MRRVTRWEAEDGSVFDTEEHCRIHERFSAVEKQLTDLVEGDMNLRDTHETVQFIIRNREKIQSIFMEFTR